MEDDKMTVALFQIIEECLKHPAKKKDFVREGTLGLLLELCRSSKRLGLKSHALGALAVLSHQNDNAKADLVEQGGSKMLLSLCRPFEEILDSQSTKIEKLFCHEQAAAVLQKLTYENTFCQADLVNAGVVRHLIQLCDIFNPNGCHNNCCQVTCNYSKEANEFLGELTLNKKLIGSVLQLGHSEAAKKMSSLVQQGLDIHSIGEEIETIFQIDLYDTTTAKDIRVCTELKAKGLAWPSWTDVTEQVIDDRNSPVKSKEVKSVWSDVSLMQVIDAGHFWAHVGGEVVKNNISKIQEYLKTQNLTPASQIPQQGSLVCCGEMINGQNMTYRGRIISSNDERQVTVFSVDFGFTAVVPAESVYDLPASLNSYPPQVSLCCLSGVQAPPKNPSVLEYTAGALRNLCEINEDFRAYVVTSGGILALLKLCLIPNKRILLQAIGALSNLALDFRYRPRIGFLGGIKILLNLCLQHEKDSDIMLAVVGAIQSVLVGSSINRSRAIDAQGLGILMHVYSSADKDELRNRTLRALKNLIGKQDNGDTNESPKQMSNKPLDMRSVMDVCPTKQSNFSLSIPPDDGYRRGSTRPHPTDIERSRRRRARRGRSLVDPKPTQVAMTVEALSKQSSDLSSSESDTDSDERYAGRWTSETDVDTDGEMLIKDSNTAKISSYTKLAETLASERYYVQTHYMSFIEDETCEFSSQTNVHDISKRKISKTLCAFLNNKKCGNIYIGVRNNGEICGVRVKRKERDLLRLGLDEMVENFKPPLKHDMYKIEFVPVARPSGSESVVTRKLIEERYVIEILLLKFTGLIYTTPHGKCFFRHKSANIELTTQEVRERTIQEQEASYNDEIKRLRKELRDMRKLVKPNTSDVKPNTYEVKQNTSEVKPNTSDEKPNSYDSKPADTNFKPSCSVAKPKVDASESRSSDVKPKDFDGNSANSDDVVTNGCVVM